jgi:hypothetical protein
MEVVFTNSLTRSRYAARRGNVKILNLDVLKKKIVY